MLFVLSFKFDVCCIYNTSNLKHNILWNEEKKTIEASPTGWLWMEMSHRGPPSGASLFVFLCGNPEGGIIPVFPHAWGFPGLCQSFDLLKWLRRGKQWEFLKYRGSYLRQWPGPASDIHSYRLALLGVLSPVKPVKGGPSPPVWVLLSDAIECWQTWGVIHYLHPPTASSLTHPTWWVVKGSTTGVWAGGLKVRLKQLAECLRDSCRNWKLGRNMSR